MSTNYNSHRQSDKDPAFGVLLCLLVIAYICYFHTTQQMNPPEAKTQDSIDDSSITSPPSLISDLALENAIKTPYDKGYYDGIKDYVRFDIEDLRLIKNAVEKRNHDSEEREKRMEKIERQCIQMETAMKLWREEYLRVLWETKQKGERGLLTGWFRNGTPKTSPTLVKEEASNDVVKGGNGRAKEKDEVRYDDMKKG